MRKQTLSLFSIAIALPFLVGAQSPPDKSKTSITNWPFNKKAAISLTFDDGYQTQFTAALPILDRLKFPATFFIITGQIPGSTYQGKFIGRPVESVIRETATIPTNKNNFFERASAIPYTGYSGTLQYHTEAGGLYDESDGAKASEAYAKIDDGFKKIRNGEFKPKTAGDSRSGVTWDEIKTYASRGHEFASHTVTHPRLAVLDDANLRYELEKSKEEILKHLGPKYTFSAEGPYGTENERAVEYILKTYTASRNRMPEPWMTELNRASKINPGTSNKTYVQWQRGATTKTPLVLMNSWVDTVLTHENDWLVLVYHGVDGVGYEALSHELLDEAFQYMKKHENNLWIATFGDVAKYIRERMNARIEEHRSDDKITINVKHDLAADYNVPLTLHTPVSVQWKSVTVRVGSQTETIKTVTTKAGAFVEYQLVPNKGPVELTPSQTK